MKKSCLHPLFLSKGQNLLQSSLRPTGVVYNHKTDFRCIALEFHRRGTEHTDEFAAFNCCLHN